MAEAVLVAGQWRELARTVPRILLRVATSEFEAVLSGVASLQRGLQSHTAATLFRFQTFHAAQRENRPRHPPDRPTPAIPEPEVEELVERLAALHDAAGHVFALCAERLGLKTLRGDDAEGRWQAWEGHRAEAARHVSEGKRSLCSAKAAVQAIIRVFRVVSRRPPESPPRVAWESEAEQLLRQAVLKLAAARDAVLQMRHAVFSEFFDAWMVLSCLDERGCTQAGEQPS